MSNTSSVRSGILELRSGLTIELGSPQWFEWLESAFDSFRYVPKSNEPAYTVRKESIKGSAYWYGYRKRQGKLNKRYIGKTGDLTESRLEEVAALLSTPASPRRKQVTQKESVSLAELAQLRLDVSELQRSLRQVLSFLKLQPESPLHPEVTHISSATQSSEIERLQNFRAQLDNEIERLQSENESLRLELEEQKRNTALPDLYAIRDRVIKEWRLAKRAESKERLREFADRMISKIIC